MNRIILPALAAASALALASQAAQARSLTVEFTNENGADGFYLTPLLGIFHDGGFDSFDTGQAASQGVQEIAEDGAVGTQRALADGDAAVGATGVAANAAGFPGAPVVDPGETASFTVNVDPASDLYFSFLSMVIPSNDTFIGNDDPLAYRLFDATGNFVLTQPIDVFANEAWDAGTEVNGTAADPMGAAFAPGGSARADENGVVAGVPDLSFLTGFPRAAGGTVTGPTAGTTLLARITITETVAPVPLPASALLLLAGIGGLAAARRRR